MICFVFLEWRNFCINSLKYITEQPSDLKYLIPSLITLNTKRLLNIYEYELKTTDDLSKVKITIIYKENLSISKFNSYLPVYVYNKNSIIVYYSHLKFKM